MHSGVALLQGLFSLADVTHSFQCTARNWRGGVYYMYSGALYERLFQLSCQLISHQMSSQSHHFFHLALVPRLDAVLASAIHVQLCGTKQSKSSATMLHQKQRHTSSTSTPEQKSNFLSEGNGDAILLPRVKCLPPEGRQNSEHFHLCCNRLHIRCFH